MQIDTDPLHAALDDAKRDIGREAAEVWLEHANEVLRNSEYDLDPIAEAAVGPRWDGESWVVGWDHVAAVYHEYGADARTIRAKEGEVLAFTWPDAPAEVREQFRETFPVVFFQKTTVDGVPAARFARGGREAARRYLEQR